MVMMIMFTKSKLKQLFSIWAKMNILPRKCVTVKSSLLHHWLPIHKVYHIQINKSLILHFPFVALVHNTTIYTLILFPSFCFQENIALVVPWIIGFITFMALEAVAMVYSNVLRDHVNRVSKK